MEGHFKYLLERIRDAEFMSGPFRHLYLTDFLSDSDFKDVIHSQEIELSPASSLDSLFSKLDKASYEPIDFPGCTKSKLEYQRWLERSLRPALTHGACESQGMALCLRRPKSQIVTSLDSFFRSSEFLTTVHEKFGISRPTTIDAGIQKYLHGYEISPHPDIRQKALTWMLNVNPASNSEDLEIHTHYLEFKPEWSFVPSFWEHNPQAETCWVPWAWCETIKRQTENNSIVLFSPRWNTVHAVRARYDHLTTQRTQFYGNLWYESVDLPCKPEFRDFDFSGRANEPLADYLRSPRKFVRKATLKAQATADAVIHGRRDPLIR